MPLPNLYIIPLSGDFVVGNRNYIRQKVLDALYAGHRRIVLDMRAVHSLDPAAVGMLLSVTRRVRQEPGGELYLAGVNDDHRHRFRTTRLEHLFAFLPALPCSRPSSPASSSVAASPSSSSRRF